MLGGMEGPQKEEQWCGGLVIILGVLNLTPPHSNVEVDEVLELVPSPFPLCCQAPSRTTTPIVPFVSPVGDHNGFGRALGKLLWWWWRGHNPHRAHSPHAVGQRGPLWAANPLPTPACTTNPFLTSGGTVGLPGGSTKRRRDDGVVAWLSSWGC